MKNKPWSDIGPGVGDRENGRSSRKPRGLKEHEKSETLQVLWYGCKVGNMGAISQDAAGSVSNGHIKKGLVYWVIELGQCPESCKQTLADFMEENKMIDQKGLLEALDVLLGLELACHPPLSQRKCG